MIALLRRKPWPGWGWHDGQPMKQAFGLDFAGYSSGKTGFAHARQIDTQPIQITIYTDHPFAQRLSGGDLLSESAQKERELLRWCINQGPVMVDLPLNLENLPAPENARYVWELVHRPVDYALNAMAPLANLIGAPVARFQYLFSGLPTDWLGTYLFETYPAISLELLGLRGRGYKTTQGVSITFQGGAWHGTGKAAIMADNTNRLGWVAEAGTQINDDEFDAALCALTGVVDEALQLRGERLNAEITHRIQAKIPASESFQAPSSFVLLERIPELWVTVSKQNFADQPHV